MGHNHSLHVDYETLNKQMAQSQFGGGGHSGSLPERALEVPRRRTRREQQIRPVKPPTPEPLLVARAISLPNVNDLEHPQQPVSRDSPPLSPCPLRERRQTISQPIRVPTAPLTEANVHHNSLSPEFTPVLVPPVHFELVKIEDIEIHFDPSSAAAVPTTSTPHDTGSLGHQRDPNDRHLYADHRVHNRRIGSAPSDYFMADFSPQQGQKLPLSLRRRHFSTGIDTDALLPSCSSPQSSFYPKPKRGQSLISFLQSINFSTSSELEQENAHFHICQGVICALEQVKWETKLAKMRSQEEGAEGERVFSSHDCDQPATDESTESLLLSDGSVTADCDLMSVSTSNLSAVVPGVAAEWPRDSNSAEEVALNLLSKFRDGSLPKASDIYWIRHCGGISPGSSGRGSFGDPRAGDSWSTSAFYRGTSDWAPPRPQIIFTQKGFCKNRKKVLQDQHYRCRGCGTFVSVEYRSKFRWCEYTGQYYCTGCHRNQMSVIPARVLDDWNFKLYPVAAFAYHLLEEIWSSPLFQVSTINPDLYGRITALDVARFSRMRLRCVKDHISACRFYVQEGKGIFQNVPDYITTEPGLWSMADLVAVKQSGFKQYVHLLSQQCQEHIDHCELCLARGYFCEHCKSGTVIFPWQSNTWRCTDCGCCIHMECFLGSLKECPRCLRIRHRK